MKKERNTVRAPWLKALFAVNAVGFAYGIYYYWPQLQSTPPALWPFVLDSPLPLLFANASILLALAGKKPSALLDLLASAGMLKFGIWSVFAIAFYNEYFLAPAVAGWFATLLLLHVGEALEGIFFAYRRSFRWGAVAVAIAWLLLGDYFDYFSPWQTHPAIPIDGRLAFNIAAVAVLSLAIPPFAKLVGEKTSRGGITISAFDSIVAKG
ncbi:DUF1405 domain-containing protein [Candidatus Micrarchaeota archaeon]|nr:DUF1405 domain-containing protein [Candidatus Micrarchaeota archaeon]MBI5177082.1 DUF1405 domain-containing protein [Candidatus Micrarchaeota archaeon]